MDQNTGKGMFQSLLEATMDHYSREAINSAIDFVAGLSEDDLKQWTSGMGIEQAGRCYRVWRAARGEKWEGGT